MAVSYRCAIVAPMKARHGYGYPRSLGCGEAPIPIAVTIRPYLEVGTLLVLTS
jgi:hypothetical protein